MYDLEEILKNTLKEKLNRVEKKADFTEISNLLNGRYIDSEKKIFRAEYIYRLPLSHGSFFLDKFNIPLVIKSWAGISEEICLSELLFYDTETTGLSHGVGTWVFLTGFGRFYDDRFVLRQYFLGDPAAEDIYLQAMEAEFHSSCIPVSYNGRSFDANLINMRYLMNGRHPVLAGVPDIDLLYLSRRFWRRVLCDCSLNNLEDKLLGLIRDPEDDLPSEDIPQIYFNYLETGNAALLKKVFTHNRTDILSLPVLFAIIARVIERDSPIPIDESGVARLFSDQGDLDQAEEFFLQGINGAQSDICLRQLSFLYKRNGRLEDACLLWEQAAASESYALVELAKIAEHRDKDYHQALRWTEQAEKITWTGEFVSGRQIADLQKRKNRLLTKIKRTCERENRA
jgi:uncharacterized protein